MRMPWNRAPEPAEQQNGTDQPDRRRELENRAIAALMVATDETLPTAQRIDAARVLKNTQDEYRDAQ